MVVDSFVGPLCVCMCARVCAIGTLKPMVWQEIGLDRLDYKWGHACHAEKLGVYPRSLGELSKGV